MANDSRKRGDKVGDVNDKWARDKHKKDVTTT
jgi:hypothetical protein